LLAWPTSSSLDALSLSVMFVGGFCTGEVLASSQMVNLDIEQCVWTLLLQQWYWPGRSNNLKHDL
jgi:hypothetical protein